MPVIAPYPQPDLPLSYSGKVRDLYDIDDQHCLIVASDRLSAFDVVLPDPIPGKGIVLTAMAKFWFDRFRSRVVNHLDLATITLDEVLCDPTLRESLAPRCMVSKRVTPLPIEAIVRGYLAGSGWVDYQRDRAIGGIVLPPGLLQAQKLQEPLFTPSTKAALGEHDQTIDPRQLCDLIGVETARAVSEISLDLYREASDYAAERGIIIADTKFEFGLDDNGQLVLIDEILTPDSSRFWSVDRYRTGISPPSFDKQFVRDYLLTLDWDRTPPGPKLPDDVIAKTGQIYRAALEILTRA